MLVYWKLICNFKVLLGKWSNIYLLEKVQSFFNNGIYKLGFAEYFPMKLIFLLPRLCEFTLSISLCHMSLLAVVQTDIDGPIYFKLMKINITRVRNMKTRYFALQIGRHFLPKKKIGLKNFSHSREFKMSSNNGNHN